MIIVPTTMWTRRMIQGWRRAKVRCFESWNCGYTWRASVMWFSVYKRNRVEPADDIKLKEAYRDFADSLRCFRRLCVEWLCVEFLLYKVADASALHDVWTRSVFVLLALADAWAAKDYMHVFPLTSWTPIVNESAIVWLGNLNFINWRR